MKTPSIKKNFVFNIFNQIISVALPLIVTPYLSRVFLADGIGINSYTSANVTYFMLFSMLGISGYGQRTIAICRDDKKETSKVFWELQTIHFITIILTSIVYFAVICASVNYRIYYIAQYTMLLSTFFDINWFYQAYERFEFITIRNFIVRITMLGLLFLLIHDKSDLPLYIFLNGMSLLLSNISLWFGIKKKVEFVPIKSLNLKRHIKDIMIFFLPTIAASVYSILDKSVINWVTKDESQNGYYEQAYKILQIANILVQTLATVSAPRMSNVFSNGTMTEFKNRLNEALRFMLMLAMPVCFGVCGIASNFVPIFFGVGYDEVTRILYVFMPMVVVLGFSVYLDGMYLIPAGRRLESALAVVAGSVTNFFLNFFLVIHWAAFGAAIATLVTEVLVASIMIVLSRKMVNWKDVVKSFGKYLICSVLMFVLVKYVGNLLGTHLATLFVQIGLGVLVYFIILLSIRDSFLRQYLHLLLRKIKKGR